MSEQRLHFSSASTCEDSATFAVTDGNESFIHELRGKFLAVSVSEEKAVDSYNQTFECTLHLTVDQVSQLRDWLNEHFPRNPRIHFAQN